MTRFTQKSGDGYALAADITTQDAVARLAAFENAYEELETRHSDILKEIDRLRAQGKANSIRFKEMAGRKVMDMTTFGVFKYHGVE